MLPHEVRRQTSVNSQDYWIGHGNKFYPMKKIKRIATKVKAFIGSKLTKFRLKCKNKISYDVIFYKGQIIV